MTARDIIERFQLEPLPHEGGYFRRIYTHNTSLFQTQPLASAIHFLITEQQFSAMHRLPSDELFHFYAGHVAEMLQLAPDGSITRLRLGHDYASAEQPTALVPANHWQGMRLAGGAPPGAFAFFGVSVHPAFQWETFELGDCSALSAAFPDASREIATLTRA